MMEKTPSLNFVAVLESCEEKQNWNREQHRRTHSQPLQLYLEQHRRIHSQLDGWPHLRPERHLRIHTLQCLEI